MVMEKKSKEVISVLTKVFPKQMNRIDKGLCPICGNEVIMEDFKNELSIREYNISGMCQVCQDQVFAVDE